MNTDLVLSRIVQLVRQLVLLTEVRRRLKITDGDNFDYEKRNELKYGENIILMMIRIVLQLAMEIIRYHDDYEKDQFDDNNLWCLVG